MAIRTLSGLLFAALLLAAVGTSLADLLGEPPPFDLPGDSIAAIVDAGYGRIVAAGISGSRVWTSTSSDEGRSFAPALVAFEGSAPSRAALCADVSGRLALIVLDDGAVMLATSTEFGAVWSDAARLGPAESGAAAHSMAVACNGAGTKLAVWEETSAAGAPRIAAVMLDETDMPRGPAILASMPAADGGLESSEPAVGPGREGWVVWQQRDDAGGPWRVYLSRSLDGGASWGFGGEPIPLPTGGAADRQETSPDIAVRRGDHGFEVSVAWVDDRDGTPRVRVTRSDRAGDPGSWLEEPTLPGGGLRGEESTPLLCSTGHDLFAVWRCLDGGEGAALSNVSGDGGETWDEAAPLPLEDEGALDVPGMMLLCGEGDPGIALSGLSVTPRRGRRLLASVRGPMRALGTEVLGAAAWRTWEPPLEPVDFHPARHGTRIALAAGRDSHAVTGLDLDEQAGPAVNATAGESRVSNAGALGAIDASGPDLAGGGGRFVIAGWLETDPQSGLHSLRAALSPNAGGSWVPAAEPIATEDAGPLASGPALALASSGTGNAIAAFQRSASGGRNLDAAFSERAWGFRWRAAGSLGPAGQEPSRVATCAGRAGDEDLFHLAWISRRSGSGQVRYARSLGGAAWEPIQRLDSSGAAVGEPSLACDDQGRVSVVWEDRGSADGSAILQRCSGEQGAAGTWSPEQRLDGAAATRDASRPDLATDGDGAFGAAWIETDTVSGATEVQMAHACGGCGSWTPPVRLASPLSPPHQARIALAAAGHVLVAWDEDGGMLWATASADYGNNWISTVSPGRASDPGVSSWDPELEMTMADDGGAALVAAYGRADGAAEIRGWRSVAFGIGTSWKGPFTLTPLGGLGHEALGSSVELLDPPTRAVAARSASEDASIASAWTARVAGGGGADVAGSRLRLKTGSSPEVRGLRFEDDLMTLTWLPLPSDLTQYYHVYRAVARPGAVDQSVFRCREAATEATRSVDPAEPDPGRALFYLVTGVGQAVEGPSGTSLSLFSCEAPPPDCS